LHLRFAISVFDIIICLLIWGNARQTKFFQPVGTPDKILLAPAMACTARPPESQPQKKLQAFGSICLFGNRPKRQTILI
jgi:hypothetical protein